jgi:hypothetical protein
MHRARYLLALPAVLGTALIVAPGTAQQADTAAVLPRTAIVLTLPDSGGYLINEQPVAWSELPTQVVAIYGQRPMAGRVLHVAPVPAGRRADLAYVEATARQASVRLVRLSGAR